MQKIIKDTQETYIDLLSLLLLIAGFVNIAYTFKTNTWHHVQQKNNLHF